LKVDRQELIDDLGGEAAVRRMDREARADAIEDHLSAKLDAAVAPKPAKAYPTVADHANAVEGRGYRRGIGRIFFHEHNIRSFEPDESPLKVSRLAPMPEKPTLVDFFNLRFAPAAHLLQSARLARKKGVSEEIVLACLLHDA